MYRAYPYPSKKASELEQKTKAKPLTFATYRTLLEQGAWLDAPQPFLELLISAAEILKRGDSNDLARTDHLCITFENIYICLSILCEQQKMIQEFLEGKNSEDFFPSLSNDSVLKESKLDTKFQQKAEDTLHDIAQSCGKKYTLVHHKFFTLDKTLHKAIMDEYGIGTELNSSQVCNR